MTTIAPATQPSAAELSQTPLSVAVVLASIRSERFGCVPAQWLTEQAAEHPELNVELIDLADYDLPADLDTTGPNGSAPEQVARLGARLQAADAFIMVTPVYNRSYPASLKNAIDWFYQPWQLKPVGFLSYGGTYGGLESVEALRAVFAEFHTVTLAEPLTFDNFWERFDDDGRPLHAEAATRRTHRLLEQLSWWAAALRQARAQSPYPHGDDDEDR